ncbi:MAG: type II toxin-antitoxin system CcdA family antitoxin [Candidatus Micrarchaeaceae archaeon]
MKTSVIFTIDTDVYEKLKRMDINKSNLVNEYLKYYVERHYGKTDQPVISDPINEKKLNLLRTELQLSDFKVLPYYESKKELLDLFLWEKAKEYGSKFELKTDQALRIIEDYLNAKKSTSVGGIQNSNVLNSTIK